MSSYEARWLPQRACGAAALREAPGSDEQSQLGGAQDGGEQLKQLDEHRGLAGRQRRAVFISQIMHPQITELLPGP